MQHPAHWQDRAWCPPTRSHSQAGIDVLDVGQGPGTDAQSTFIQFKPNRTTPILKANSYSQSLMSSSVALKGIPDFPICGHWHSGPRFPFPAESAMPHPQ